MQQNSSKYLGSYVGRNYMPKYYLSINEKYDEEKTTIFRQERKILNQHIFVEHI
jgi:hypothetical protein